MKYDAFLSYSHAAGERLASAIELALEELGKRWDERRALLVFRDNSKQGVSANLSADLYAKLDSARFLVLLASPEAAQSPWVAQEIVHWINTKGLAQLLLALVGGELVWDAAACCFDRVRTTALPDQLLKAYAAEPKWVDFRWANKTDNLSIADEHFADCVADLSSAIQGRSKDEIVGIQLVEYRKLLCRQLSGQSQVLINDSPDLALLLAAAAFGLSDNPDTRRTLLSLLEATADLGSVLGVEGCVKSFAIETSGSTLLVGLGDGTIEEWDVKSAQRCRIIDHQRSQPVLALAFNLNGSAFAAGFADGEIVVETLAGRSIGTFRTAALPEFLALDSEARQVVVAGPSSDKKRLILEICDISLGTRVSAPYETFEVLNHLCFGSDDSVVMAFDLGNVRIFDAHTGVERKRLDLPFYLRPGPKAYTPNGLIGVYVPFSDGLVSLYDVTRYHESREEQTLSEQFTGIADGVGISPKADAVAVVSGRRLMVMDPATGRSVSYCVGVPPGQVNLSLLDGGRTAVVLGSDSGQLRYPGRKSRLGKVLAPPLDFPSAIRGVGDAAFSPNGKLVAWIARPVALEQEETVTVWNCSEERKAASMASGSAFQIAFQSNEQVVVLDTDGTVSVWDVASGKLISSIAKLSDESVSAATLWCPANRGPVIMMRDSDGTAAIYSVVGGGTEIIWRRPGSIPEYLLRFEISRGNRFALSASGVVEVWDLDGNRKYATEVSDAYLPEISLSGDGRFLAIADRTNNLEIHDVDAGIRLIETAVSSPIGIAFSADANTLFLVRSDSRITLYDRSTGLVAGTLQGTAAEWTRLRTGPEARWLAEIYAGGGFTLWDVDPMAWRAMAQQVAGRELSDKERIHFRL